MHKKTLITFLVFITFATTAGAQLSNNALGLRAGGAGTINRIELSYQRATGKYNRLEFDAGVGTESYHDQLHLAAIFHWHHNVIGSFSWFGGPGAAFGLDSGNLGFYVGGQLGAEFNLRKAGLPFNISLDIRPMWSLYGHEAFDYTGAIGVRYIWPARRPFGR